jgi:hypothetical protein
MQGCHSYLILRFKPILYYYYLAGTAMLDGDRIILATDEPETPQNTCL